MCFQVATNGRIRSFLGAQPHSSCLTMALPAWLRLRHLVSQGPRAHLTWLHLTGGPPFTIPPTMPGLTLSSSFFHGPKSEISAFHSSDLNSSLLFHLRSLSRCRDRVSPLLRGFYGKGLGRSHLMASTVHCDRVTKDGVGRKCEWVWLFLWL